MLLGVVRAAETLESTYRPASGQHATGRGGEPVALAGGDELLHGLAVCGKTGREDPSIPRARHQSRTGRGDGAVPG